MKRSKIWSVALVAMLSVAGVSAQTTQKLTATKANEYGLIYSLPKTVLDITIEAEKEVKKPGEYFKYAKKYLDSDNAIAQTSQQWTLKSITVNVRAVADADERYLVQFKKGTTPYMYVNDQNFPLAINTEKVYEVEAPVLPEAKAAEPTPLETAAATQVISQEMLQSQSSAKRAELAANQIYALRQSRTDLITGQADQMPPDGQAMQLVLDNIAAQEAALTAMFMGTVQHSTDVKTFTIVPDSLGGESIVARLSALNGIVDSDDLSGCPIYVNIEVAERGQLPVNEATGLVKTFPKGGIAYRIPGKAKVAVEYDGQKVYDKTIDMAQYGVVFGIDPSMITNTKAPAYVVFDPLTGAIKELGTKQ
ncbi:MAG: DUF4831 family protein [Muribaculaceae bacterium]|nr:DUF4831 family protein [Muribaculaceae bacterium]